MSSPAGHLGGVVLSVEADPFARLGHCVFLAQRRRDAEKGLPVAVLAEVQRERARVDAVDAGDAVLAEIFVEAFFAAPVAWLGQVAYHQSGQKKPPGLDVLGVDSVVADFGCREGDELSGVGGVGKNLLVARHPGVEHDLAERVLLRAERYAVKHRSVIERKKRLALPLRFPFVSKTVHCFSLCSDEVPC